MLFLICKINKNQSIQIVEFFFKKTNHKITTKQQMFFLICKIKKQLIQIVKFFLKINTTNNKVMDVVRQIQICVNLKLTRVKFKFKFDMCEI